MGAQMVEPRRMARQAGFDRAQALGPGKLSIDERDQLVPRGQPAHFLVRPVPLHQPIHNIPRHEVQHRAKYCILVAHGVDLLPCREHWRMLKTQKNPRHAPRPANLNRTAVGLSRPSTSCLAASMPTVLRVSGFRFFFYSLEGSEPAHIHVEHGDNTAKFWLEDRKST